MYDERLSGVGCSSFVRSWRPDNLLFIRHFALLSAQVSLDLQQESSSPSCWQWQKKSALQTIFLLRMLCVLHWPRKSAGLQRDWEKRCDHAREICHTTTSFSSSSPACQKPIRHLRQFLFAISFLADTFFFVHFETPLEIETTFHLCLPRHQLISTRSTLARHFNILLTLSPPFWNKVVKVWLNTPPLCILFNNRLID